MIVNRYFCSLIICLFTFGCGGCIENQTSKIDRPAFETVELEAALAIVVDMSASFANNWDDRAYKLFLQLMDRFFMEGMGSGESRVVLGQISGNANVILFEGTPAEVRKRFRSPEELNEFLKQNSEPNSSPVYEATERMATYMSTMPGVTDNTQLLLVTLSDLAESEPDAKLRSQKGHKMIDALKRYQQQGGGLALYFVSQDETSRWQLILGNAGFEAGQYVIQHDMVANAQLPRFD